VKKLTLYYHFIHLGDMYWVIFIMSGFYEVKLFNVHYSNKIYYNYVSSLNYVICYWI